MTTRIEGKSDLPIRESILGILKNKDTKGEKTIHSSDFRKVIADVGLPFGSPVVENVLIHCKIDQSGNIHFADLETSLSRERPIFNNKQEIEKQKKRVPTSSATPISPWRADVVHQKKIAAERQAHCVQEHRNKVRDVFTDLSHHKLDANNAIHELRKLEINPTAHFMKVLDTMKAGEVEFLEFYRSLTTPDDKTGVITNKAIPAGGYKMNPLEKPCSIGEHRKRFGPQPVSYFKNEKEALFRTGKRINVNEDANVKRSSAVVKEILTTDKNPTVVISHAHSQMVSGKEGREVNLKFNSEQKLQREQIAAALRKLDAGIISMDNFQEMVFSMGFELPPTIVAEIQRDVSAGRIDLKKQINLLDKTVFKVNALEERLDTHEIKSIKERFSNIIHENGLNSIFQLSKTFENMDKNKDGSLSFTEFKNGCKEMENMKNFNENELQTIFHAFDNNGDGILPINGFLSDLRGNLHSKRANIVRQAFIKLDRNNQGKVKIDEVKDKLPLLEEELKNLLDGKMGINKEGNDEINDDMSVQSFQSNSSVLRSPTSTIKKPKKYPKPKSNSNNNKKDPRTFLTEADFTAYYASISPHFKTDEEFINFVKTNCGLDESLIPAPPEYFPLKTNKLPPPRAKQTHGDIIKWKQEASNMEKADSKIQTGVKLVAGFEQRNLHTDVMHWKNDKPGHDPFKEEFVEECGINFSKGKKNLSSPDLVKWTKPSKTPIIASPKSKNLETLTEKEEKPKKEKKLNVTLTSYENLSQNKNLLPPKLPYQEELKPAGSPAFTQLKEFKKSSIKHKPELLKNAHIKVTCPFGVDEEGYVYKSQLQNSQGLNKKDEVYMGDLVKLDMGKSDLPPPAGATSKAKKIEILTDSTLNSHSRGKVQSLADTLKGSRSEPNC